MQLVRKTVCNTISASPALIDSRSDSLNGAKRPLPFMCSLLRGSDVGSCSRYKLAFLMRRPSLRAVRACCCEDSPRNHGELAVAPLVLDLVQV